MKNIYIYMWIWNNSHLFMLVHIINYIVRCAWSCFCCCCSARVCVCGSALAHYTHFNSDVEYFTGCLWMRMRFTAMLNAFNGPTIWFHFALLIRLWFRAVMYIKLFVSRSRLFTYQIQKSSRNLFHKRGI